MNATKSVESTRSPTGAASHAPHLGYRLTEVGTIPEDWDIRLLRSCLRCAPNYGINAPAVPLDDRLPTYLRITDISDDHRFAPSPRVSVRHSNATSFFLNDGDVVFARTGASVGKSYLYRAADGPLVFAGFLIRVSPNPSKLHPAYLSYYLQSQRYWDWVAAMSARSGQPGINGQEYGTLQLPLPAPAEQHAIAEALSDVDGLIGALEALIAKKRAIKQAAMQQLLTGKTRLPAFHGEWETKRLAEVGYFLKGSGVKRDDALSGPLACVRYGEIYTTHDDYIRSFHSWISPEVAATATRLKFGDLVFAGSGETKEEIGKCVAFALDMEAYAGGDIVILRPTDVDSLFLGYALNASEVARQKASLGQGDAVVHISSSALAQVSVHLPLIREQNAIATVLSDMDAEIAALEARRDKTRAIKQGMMQQLLTGRVRLVKPEQPSAA